jgi:GAF domain-containing protein
MQFVMDRLFALRQFQQESERDRARLVVILAVAILAIFGLYAVVSPEWPASDGQYQPMITAAREGDSPALASLLVTFISGVVALAAVRLGSINVGRLSFTCMIFGIALLPPLVSLQLTFSDGIFVTVTTLGIVILFLVNDRRGGVVSTAIAITAYLLDPGDQTFLITTVLTMITGAVVGELFVRYSTRARVEGARESAEERARLADATTQLVQLGGQHTTMTSALSSALAIIADRYSQFQALRLFLLGEDEVQARQAAETGDVPEDSQHTIAIGSLNPIGQTLYLGQMHSIRQGARYRDDRLSSETMLPGMRTEISLPVRLGGKIFGALDLQSRRSLEPGKEDLISLQSLADSLALLIANTRQIEQAQERIAENQRLADQTRNALAEVQRLNKRLIGRAWAEYLKEQQSEVGYTADFVAGTNEMTAEWTPGLREAIQRNALILRDNVAVVPLRVRGQVIGAMEIELEHGRLNQNYADLLQEISERFGLAAENTRLVEQSQRAAQRESLINVVSTRLQTTTNVESTLAETARSMAELLLVERVAIRLGSPPASPGPGSGNGDHP